MNKPKGRAPSPHDPQEVWDTCVAVYKARLGPKDTASMITKDKDQGQKLAVRAQSYAPIIRAVLDYQLKEKTDAP